MNKTIPLKAWLKQQYDKSITRSFIIGANVVVILCLLAGYFIQSEYPKSLAQALETPIKNWVNNGDFIQLKQLSGQLVDKKTIDFLRVVTEQDSTVLINDPFAINDKINNHTVLFDGGRVFYLTCGDLKETDQKFQLCLGKRLQLGWFLLIGLFFVLFYFFVTAIIFKQSIHLSNTLVKQIFLISEYIKSPFNIADSKIEVSEVEEVLAEINETNIRIQNLATSERISQVASQISHDIRSPLSALDMISTTLSELPEEKRLIIKNSINRIKDIANQLNPTSKITATNHETNEQSNSLLEISLLLPIIEALITEKRFETRNYPEINIEMERIEDAFGLFAKIIPSEFQRVFSNIVNNAIESLQNHQGWVKISLHAEADFSVLTIRDCGQGIPTEILPNLGTRGGTFNKKGGSGLGLSHAKSTVDSWGGSLVIESTIGIGTTIKIYLPKETPPKWFVPNLKLFPYSSVVVFDDDPSIHQIWKKRLNAFSSEGLRLYHFSTLNDLRKFYRQNFAELDEAVFLMDYEISGHQETGLDLIEEFGIVDRSILVTSRYDETQIRQRCEALGVRLLPKSMSGFIPILQA